MGRYVVLPTNRELSVLVVTAVLLMRKMFRFSVVKNRTFRSKLHAVVVVVVVVVVLNLI